MLINPENALTTQDDKAIIEQKITELGNAIMGRANQDRQTAKDIYEFIRNEISQIEEDYDKAKHIYNSAFEAMQGEPNDQIRGVMLCKLGKPPRKQNIVHYIEQMNKAVENSIKSSDNIVNLLNVITKANATPKVKIDKVEVNNRSLLLDQIIKEEEEEKLNNKYRS